MKPLYRLLAVVGDVRAASRGPAALGRRYLRKRSHRSLARLLRKAGL